MRTAAKASASPARASPAQILYDRLRAQLRPGAATGPWDGLSWCGPGLVSAVALPLGAGAAGLELWLGAGARPRDLPRRWRIGGHWVDLAVHAGGHVVAQAAQASNLDADRMRAGMVSAVVRDRLHHDRHYVLSCGHVLAGNTRARKGDRIELSDGRRVLGHGTLEDWAPVLGDGIPHVGIDAGIVRIDAALFEALPRSLLPGGVSTSYRLDQDVVLKLDPGINGRLKTRWSGYVDVAGSERPEDYFLENAIGYLLDRDPDAGDSGTAVWNGDGKLVGIHVGAPGGDERWRSNAILCPIDRIMDWFDIEPLLSDGRVFAAMPADAAFAPRAAVPDVVAPPAGTLPAAAADEDIAVVAMTLWGEARGEGEQGMQAVACVIGNRVRRRWRRKTGYVAVCRDRWQFSCWNENDPNLRRLEAVRRNPDAAYRLAAAIAGRLVRGELDDFTFGATHYYAVSLPRPPKWAVNKQPCYRQGKHLFFNNID